MQIERPFNPLDKKNLGVSVAEALLGRPRSSLPPKDRFEGAGVYAIYYKGQFAPYQPIARKNQSRDEKDDVPIYVGKAVPAGARKGGLGLDAPPGAALYNRLVDHAGSIIAASGNLKIEDFFCRYLAVEDIWIPLGENLLIEMFCPLWNKVVDGFGNHDPGKGRHQGRLPAWDVLHPGRIWASRLQPGVSEESILASISRAIAVSAAREDKPPF